MSLEPATTNAQPSVQTTVQTWNTSNYAHNGRFVATLASGVVALLAPRVAERILDAGCGDGVLTEQLAESGALIRGVDSSPTMVSAARERGLTIDQADLTNLPYLENFDAVFSNAALHWISLSRQPALLASVHRALRPGGRFVAEMGGMGNIAAIRTALASVLAPYQLDSEALAASFFPSPGHYRTLLEATGFTVQSIELIPRPTPLPGGPDGMTRWLETFRNGVLDTLPPPARACALATTVDLLRPILFNPSSNSWSADYVRLRFHATRAA